MKNREEPMLYLLTSQRATLFTVGAAAALKNPPSEIGNYPPAIWKRCA